RDVPSPSTTPFAGQQRRDVSAGTMAPPIAKPIGARRGHFRFAGTPGTLPTPRSSRKNRGPLTVFSPLPIVVGIWLRRDVPPSLACGGRRGRAGSVSTCHIDRLSFRGTLSYPYRATNVPAAGN